MPLHNNARTVFPLIILLFVAITLPLTAKERTTPYEIKKTRDVIFGRTHLDNGSTIDRIMDISEPQDCSPAKKRAILCLHGNPGDKPYPGGRQQGFEEYIQYFVPKGYMLFVPSWDLVDHGTGGPLAQIKTAVRHVRANAVNYGIDPDHIGVVGHSYGGSWAMVLAGTGDDIGVLNEQEQADPENHWGISAKIQASIAVPGGIFYFEECDEKDAPIFYVRGTKDKNYHMVEKHLKGFEQGNAPCIWFPAPEQPHWVPLTAEIAFGHTLGALLEDFLAMHLLNDQDRDMAQIHLIRHGAGNITMTPDARFVPKGSEVDVLAKADQDHHFIRWEGDLSGMENPKTINISKNMRIIAIFE